MTVAPTAMVTLKGVNEKPGIETVVASGMTGPVSSFPPHAAERTTVAMRARSLPIATSVVLMRKPQLVITMLVAALTLSASGVSAQACLGLPSFTVRSVHVHAAVDFPDSATSYALGVGAGKPNGLFANLGAGQASYQGLAEKATFGLLEFGLQVPVGRMQVCPIAGGYLSAGPDESNGAIKVTTRGASAGAAAGLPFDVGPLGLIPRAAVIYGYVSQKVAEEGGGSATQTLNSGVVDVGLGLVFRDRWSVQPVGHLPFSGQNQVSIGVLASMSFSWGRSPFSLRTR